MADERRPLVDGEFAWNIRREGKMTVTFGADPFASDNEDMWLMPDPKDPTKVVFVEPPCDAVQNFITLGPEEYAVIHNPSISFTDDHPNGSWKSGKGYEIPTLAHGKRRVVSGGRFPIWPGQRVVTMPVHRLSTSEYLVVLVESSGVDTSAPYYDLTARCAAIRRAQVDETVDSKEESPLTATIPASDSPTAGEADGSASEGQQPETLPASSAATDTVRETGAAVTTFTVGQRIIIPGNMTPTYIPPSGIKVIAESEVGSAVELPPDNLEAIRACIVTGTLRIENLREWLLKADLDESYYGLVEDHYTQSRRTGDQAIALIEGLTATFSRNQIGALAAALRKAAVKPTKPDSAIRQAVVLGPTEFCVLLDEDGKPQTKQGPGRVFPGPYDRIRMEGSRDGVYQAYHLRTDRGILLRVVAEITREELRQQLPPDTELADGKPIFHKGDEVFIGGHDAYFVPSSSIEVINPKSRQPHIGNQHSEAYVAAIGVDQKSGVYVANVETGNVLLVKGEVKLLLDPRKQAHVHRKIPASTWNLLIGRGEQHKLAPTASMVETPWALSVIVPNNEALLITSKDGRRVVIGPYTALFEYEEWPEILQLSGGTPKGTGRPIETCFLRVTGNRVSDVVDVVTADFVTVQFHVRYGVTFVGDTSEAQAKWFNHTDYVSLLCENERSRLRAAARQLTLSELYATASDFVRDTVLGTKGEGDAHRPGHLFDENNMYVTEVEILDVSIPDPDVADSLAQANRAIVQHEITGKGRQADLVAAQQQAEIDGEKAQLELSSIKRTEDVATARAVSNDRLRRSEFERDRIQREAEQKMGADLAKAKLDTEKLLSDLRREILEADSQSQLELDGERNEAAAGFRKRLTEIECELLAAYAKADVDRANAVQPQLVEAISGLGDKQVLTALAENLPPSTGELGMALGIGGFTGILQMLSRSSLAAALEQVGQSVQTLEAKNAADTSADGEQH